MNCSRNFTGSQTSVLFFIFFVVFVEWGSVFCKNRRKKKTSLGYSGLGAACHLSSCTSLAHFKTNEKELTSISKEYFSLIQHFVLTACLLNFWQ